MHSITDHVQKDYKGTVGQKMLVTMYKCNALSASHVHYIMTAVVNAKITDDCVYKMKGREVKWINPQLSVGKCPNITKIH